MEVTTPTNKNCENDAWPPCMDLDFESVLEDICESEQYETVENRRTGKKTLNKKSRHVPHCLQPVQTVKKRNARERSRINTVNQQFIELRKLLPIKRKKRIAKEKILKFAMSYIEELRRMIEEHDSKEAKEKMTSSCRFTQASHSYALPGNRDYSKRGLSDHGLRQNMNQENDVNDFYSELSFHQDQSHQVLRSLQPCVYGDSQPCDTWSNTTPPLTHHTQVECREVAHWQASHQSSPTWFSIFGSSV